MVNGQTTAVKISGDGLLNTPVKFGNAGNNNTKGKLSEEYVAKNSSDDFKREVVFLNKKEIKGKGSPKDSVRLDLCSINGNCSIEVKNYDLSRQGGQGALVSKVAEQAVYRVGHIPDGMTQKVKIDITNQNLISHKAPPVLKASSA